MQLIQKQYVYHFCYAQKQVQNVCDAIAAYTILENNINFVICYNKLYVNNTK